MLSQLYIKNIAVIKEADINFAQGFNVFTLSLIHICGMPSAHSAFVCSITIAIAKKVGYSSPEFALALAFACVVMYDAMGVRRAAGEQAKVLNRMVLDLSNPNSLFALLGSHPEKELDEDEDREQKELNEFLGHTPLEVLGGALLGILIAMIVPVF